MSADWNHLEQARSNLATAKMIVNAHRQGVPLSEACKDAGLLGGVLGAPESILRHVRSCIHNHMDREVM